MDRTTDGPPASALSAVCAAFAAVAALLVAASWALLRFVFAGAPLPAMPPPYPGIFAAVAAAALVAAPLAEGRLMRLGKGERRHGAPFAGYRRAKIVGFTLRALVAVNGFLLALGTGRLAWSFLLSTAALIAMALAWPRRSDLEDERR